MGCVRDLKPVDVEPCCVPLEKHDVTFRDCGSVEDGCGGVIDFGPCAHDATKLEEQAEQLVVQAQEEAKTIKLEERRLLNLEEELEELKEEGQIAQQEAFAEAGIPPPSPGAPEDSSPPPGSPPPIPGAPVVQPPSVPKTEAQAEIEQEIVAKVEEMKKAEAKIEVVEQATVSKIKAAQKNSASGKESKEQPSMFTRKALQ